MTDLKPCPNEACRGNDIWKFGNRLRWVCCGTCDTSGPTKSTENEAVAAWNALPRALPPGWKAVPVRDVTDAMREAAQAAFAATANAVPPSQNDPVIEAAKAAIAAAPEVPSDG